MTSAVQMVVVSGVRYRPEDAPKSAPKAETEAVEKKGRAPRKAPESEK